jgi:hypothetical protein
LTWRFGGGASTGEGKDIAIDAARGFVRGGAKEPNEQAAMHTVKVQYAVSTLLAQ